MKKDFVVMNKQKKKEIGASGPGAVGVFVTGLISLLPVITSSIASLAASFKTLNSDNGELKTKEGLTQKWETKNSAVATKSSTIKSENAINNVPIYFVY